MERPTAKLLPISLTAGVVLFVFLLKWLLALVPGLNLIERAELFTYDVRARLALGHRPPLASNLGVVYVDDYSVTRLNQDLGRFRWPWPRSVYGRVIREMKAQGAKVVGIDGLFSESSDEPPQGDLGWRTPDEFMAQEMQTAGNVVIPTTTSDIDAKPPELHKVLELFRTNAWGLGHDGLVGLSPGNSGRLRSVTLFFRERERGAPIWQMAMLMAAREMDLDLKRAEFKPGCVIIPRREGPPLRIPLYANNQVYIDWVITPNHYEDLEFPVAQFYEDAQRRQRGEPVADLLKDRLVLLGFVVTMDRANDWGPTTISPLMPQCLAHVNVLNSLLTGRFIVRAGPRVENLLIAGMAILSALIGWRLRVSWGLAAFVVVIAAYLALAVRLYVSQRYWLPVAAPVGGAFVMGYVCLLSYRAVSERQEARRVRSVFGKMVSPNIFNLLVRQPASALDTYRRNVTIYFADVRGFTHYMEENHARALKLVQGQALQGDAAQSVVEQSVRGSLETVNRYLGDIADVVKEYDGTLDKYIGDCVMAFWGAPVPSELHAVKAVQAAIAVHRALHELNLERLVENERRQKENIERLAAGLSELEPLAVLHVGSALNSGMSTVGFMGSAAHVSNYTVFGREVNIASRLEGVAEADCILATESTFLEVQRHDPDLAATFIRRNAVHLHGITEPVHIYEVPWQPQKKESAEIAESLLHR